MSANTQLDNERAASWERLREKVGRLTRPGLIAEYDHIEVNEVIATPKGGETLNVLTIAVFGERCKKVGNAEPTDMLTGRITVEGFKDWSFGVARTIRPAAVLDEVAKSFAETGIWNFSGRPIRTGALQPEAMMFVPPDGTETIPLNTVLKNNFWAGSHLARLADRDKTALTPFLTDRRRLQSLSDSVYAVLPIAFAGLADLLGDVLIQMPVTLLNYAVQARDQTDREEIAISWRPGALPRPLRIFARTRWDGTLTGVVVADAPAANDAVAPIPIEAGHELLATEILDPGSGLVIGATAPTSTISQISLNMRMIRPEPRLFTAPDADGTARPERLIVHSVRGSIFGKAQELDRRHWLLRRQDLEERQLLMETRDFAQYRPEPPSNAERARALGDLRWLIARHGEAGVDLWDPYLDANDILQTLFWSPAANAPLRALTDGRDPPRKAGHETSAEPKPTFAVRQRDRLSRDAGNREGLRLEYRTRTGPGGWEFHDRFLIFPNGSQGPLAWSLGTSVNSLGKAHHILQRVSNPALVAGAFEDLWKALDQPRHIVWRSW